VLGSANHPLGKIKLDVCFSDRGNFRREKLEFEVMDLPSQYHTILGWLAFARFMAVPHYAYLVLKIPGPNRVITVKGNFEVSAATWNSKIWRQNMRDLKKRLIIMYYPT
jgi:hypothetical protein